MGWFFGKRWFFGSNWSDRIWGTHHDDIVFGFGGDDDIKTGRGHDRVFAGRGDDTVDAGSGNDYVSGGRGDDLIIGGAGSDTVHAGSGDDTVVFFAKDNLHSRDIYSGDSGQDTLRLEFTTAEWTDAVRAEMVEYLAFIAANTRWNGETNGSSFWFESIGLKASRFEALEIIVDGVLIDLSDNSNQAPTIAAPLTQSVGEDDATATFSLLQGAQDADGDTLNVENLTLVRGDANGVTVSADSNSILIDPDAYQTLGAGLTEIIEYTYTIADGNGGTIGQSITLTVTGANDRATISGTTNGSTVENGALSANGQVTVSDIDAGENTVAPQSGTTGNYGSFAISAQGVWSYTLDNENPLVQALAEGATLSETFDITSLDGTASETIIVTITGTNDAATIAGQTSGNVVEDGALLASGLITVSDEDNGQNAVVAQAATPGDYGSFAITAPGAWTYTLDNENPLVQALAEGATLSETFDVASVDGTASETITVTVTGTNDAASLTGLRNLSVQEDGALTDAINIIVTDVDTGQAGLKPGSGEAAFGSFTVQSDGSVAYMLNNDLAAVQDLNDGEALQDNIVIETIDGQTSTISVNIAGADEVVAEPLSAALQLDSDTGKDADDQRTSEFGITGEVTGLVQANRAALQIITSNGIIEIDLLPIVTPDGTFSLSQTQIGAALVSAGETLADGLYQTKVDLRTADGQWVQSDILTVEFDQTGPAVLSGPRSTDFVQNAPDRLFIEFDEAVDPLSLSVSDIQLTDGDGAPIIVGSVIADGATGIQINLAQTLGAGSYNLSILGDGVSDAAGNQSQIVTPIAFDVTAPTQIVSISPKDSTELVNLDRKVTIKFDRPVDPETITDSSIQIIAPDEAPIEGSLRVSANGMTASFFLDDGVLLPASSTLRVFIDGEQVLDTDGNRIDADGDGIAGGIGIAQFETVSVTPVEDTNLEGFIFDSNRRGPDGEDIPLVGVVVSVIGLPGATAVTDENGRFFLQDLPVPDAFVEFDASAIEAEDGFRYGTVTKPVHTTAGQTTPLALLDGTPFNIYLASLSTADAVVLNEDTPTTVGVGADGIANLTNLFPDIDPAKWQDLTVTVPPDSLFFDDGTEATQATILAFQPDRIPAPLPQGYDPDFVFTLTAGGAKNFDSNAQVTFPNLNDLEPGARRPILSFDHDAGKWVQTGTAVVSDDGSVLTTEGEGGVNTLGWKFLGPTAVSQHSEGPSAVAPGSGTGTNEGTTDPSTITPTPIGLPDNRLNGITEVGENAIGVIRNGGAATIQIVLAGAAAVDAIAPTEVAPNPADAALAGAQSIGGVLATALDPDTEVSGSTIADAGVSAAASLTPGADQLFATKSALENAEAAFDNAGDLRENFLDGLGNIVYAATADAPSDVFGDRALEIAANGPAGPSATDIRNALNDGQNTPGPQTQNLRAPQNESSQEATPALFAHFSSAALEPEDHVLALLTENAIESALDLIVDPGRLAGITGAQSLQEYLLRDGSRISAQLDPDSPAAQAVGSALTGIAALVPTFDAAIVAAADGFRTAVLAIDVDVLTEDQVVDAFQAAQTAYSAAIKGAFDAFNASYTALAADVDLAIEATYDASSALAVSFIDAGGELADFIGRQIEINDAYIAIVEQLGNLDGSQQQVLDLKADTNALVTIITTFKADLAAAGYASLDEFTRAVADDAERLSNQLDLALSPFLDSYNPLFAQAILADGTVVRARLAPGEDFNINGPVGTEAVIRFFDAATNLYSERTITFGEDNTEGRSILSVVLTTDSDGDGIPDLGEEVIGTNPNLADSDGDGTLDGVEVRLGGVSATNAGALPTGIVGAVSFDGDAQDVVVLPTASAPGQNFALVAAGTGGLVVVDVGQATAPSLVRQIDLPGAAIALDVDAASGLALVAAGDAGLHVVDVGTPSAPLVLRTLQDVGPIHAVVSLGGLAVVGGETTLSVIDPATGAILDTIGVDGPSRDVRIDDIQVVGDIVYVIERGAREEIAVERFEVSATLVTYRLEAGSLVELDRLAIPFAAERKIEPEPFKIFVDGTTAYIPTGLEITDVSDFRPLERGGYITVDVADPAAIAVISNIDTGDNQGANFDTITNGSGKAIVAAGTFGVQLFDASNPQNTFNPITTFDTPGTARSVDLADGLVYVADGEGGLQIVNPLSEGANNTAPVVSVTLPATLDTDPGVPGFQIEAGSVIPLSLNLSDDGQVNRVAVIIDGEVQSTLLQPPFAPTALLPSLEDGEASRNVTIQVRAQDAGGLTTLSDPITVEIIADTEGPNIESISVVDGQSFIPDRTITVEVAFDSLVDANTVAPESLVFTPATGDPIFAESVTLQTQPDGTTVAIFVVDGLPIGDFTVTFDPAGIADPNGNVTDDAAILRNATVADFTNIWTATEAGDWNDANNWSANVLPDIDDRVAIETSAGVVATVSGVIDPVESVFNTGDGQLEINSAAPFLVFETESVINDGTITLRDGRIDVTNTLENSGTLEITGDGRLDFDGRDIVNTGTIRLGNAQVTPTLDRSGVIDIKSPDAFLSGGGIVELDANPDQFTANFSGISDPNNQTFTNVDNIITGTGAIGPDFKFVNGTDGVLRAEDGDRLLVSVSNFENDGTVVAQVGGEVAVESIQFFGSPFAFRSPGTIDNFDGVFEANGGTIDFTDSLVRGGTLRTTDMDGTAGVIRIGQSDNFSGSGRAGFEGILGNVVADATIDVVGDISITGNLENSGVTTLNEGVRLTAGNFFFDFAIAQLFGGGTLEMLSGAGSENRSVLEVGATFEDYEDGGSDEEEDFFDQEYFVVNTGSLGILDHTIEGAGLIGIEDVFAYLDENIGVDDLFPDQLLDADILFSPDFSGDLLDAQAFELMSIFVADDSQVLANRGGETLTIANASVFSRGTLAANGGDLEFINIDLSNRGALIVDGGGSASFQISNSYFNNESLFNVGSITIEDGFFETDVSLLNVGAVSILSGEAIFNDGIASFDDFEPGAVPSFVIGDAAVSISGDVNDETVLDLSAGAASVTLDSAGQFLGSFEAFTDDDELIFNELSDASAIGLDASIDGLDVVVSLDDGGTAFSVRLVNVADQVIDDAVDFFEFNDNGDGSATLTTLFDAPFV